MFPTPPEIQTTVFARLPDSLRLNGRRSAWIDRKRPGETLHSFLEGPSFDRDGYLYTVDIPYGRIFRISPDGEFTVACEYDGQPNGLKIREDGQIFIADHKNGIVQLDPASGKTTIVLGELKRGPFKGPNDLVFASNGDLYFTDQGDTSLQDPTGRLIRLRRDGSVDVLLDNVPSPNGLVLNKQDTILYLAVTRANAIWRVLLGAGQQGGPMRVGTFIQMTAGVGPDGLAMTENDGLVVAHPGLGTVWVFAPSGEPLHRVRSCAGGHTTNIAFGGPDKRSLFITESSSGSILRAELPLAGRTMFSGV